VEQERHSKASKSAREAQDASRVVAHLQVTLAQLTLTHLTLDIHSTHTHCIVLEQVDKIGKNLNPSADPQSGLHSIDHPAAGLPSGY